MTLNKTGLNVTRKKIEKKNTHKEALEGRMQRGTGRVRRLSIRTGTVLLVEGFKNGRNNDS